MFSKKHYNTVIPLDFEREIVIGFKGTHYRYYCMIAGKCHYTGVAKTRFAAIDAAEDMFTYWQRAKNR